MRRRVAHVAHVVGATHVARVPHIAGAPHVVHRGHLHPQQLPARGAGDELRRRLGGAGLYAPADRLERVADERAVEHRVDRTAQADQLGAARCERRGRQRAELLACALVVKQDAAVEIAHQHALGQLGHQRREPAALQFDAVAGLRDLLGDVVLQARALLRKRVQRAGQAAIRGVALRFEAARASVGQQHLGLLVELRRGFDKALEQARQAPGRHAEGAEPEHHHEHRARGQHAGHRAALRRVERGADEQHAGAGEQRQREPQRSDRNGQAVGRFQGRQQAQHQSL